MVPQFTFNHITHVEYVDLIFTNESAGCCEAEPPAQNSLVVSAWFVYLSAGLSPPSSSPICHSARTTITTATKQHHYYRPHATARAIAFYQTVTLFSTYAHTQRRRFTVLRHTTDATNF
jgi:hypothetical protein